MSEEGKLTPPVPPAPAPAAAVPAAPAAPVQASIDDFKKLVFKTGVITAAADHPNADKLLVLTVDLGEPQPRQVVAGIKSSYQAAELVGKRVVVVANLKPVVLRGVESQGMVLAASDAASMTIVSPERPIAPGNPVK